MINPIKTPQELLMEQAGLPHFAEGRSVSPEQMKVELMINGRPVHTEHLAHDHPFIQHFAGGGGAILGSKPVNDSLLGAVKNAIPEPIKNYSEKALSPILKWGLPALSGLELGNSVLNRNWPEARQNVYDLASSWNVPMMLGTFSRDLNEGEDEKLAAIHEKMKQK
jgi:hypothetical protein